MAAVVVPREGAWCGGLTTDGFAVQCRADQACDFTIEVFDDVEYKRVTPGFSTTTETVVTGHHFRGTAYVTGLLAGRKYYWRVNLDNSVDAATLGTEATYTAGSIKTISTEVSNTKFAVISCMPWRALIKDTGAFQASSAFSRLLAMNLDFAVHNDDIYYSDLFGDHPAAGATAYAAGEFFLPATDADATADKYRTNFINTYSGLDNVGALSTAPGTRSYPQKNTMAEFKAKVPNDNMWGDHDRAFNDCADRAGATGDKATRWVTGRDVGHECFMSLNKALVDQDTTWTPYVSDHHYFYRDVPPYRLIVLDTTTDGDALTDADTPSKSKLGATQKAWFKEKVDENAQKYLVVISGNMLDGNHGWDKDTSNWYGWKGYTYERDEILDYIRENGNPYSTVFIVGDTHIGGVYVDRGKNGNSVPIYSVLAGTIGWHPGNHGQINGFKGGVTGRGLEDQLILGEGSYAAVVESRRGGLEVSLECLNSSMPDGGGEEIGVKWRRLFK